MRLLHFFVVVKQSILQKAGRALPAANPSPILSLFPPSCRYQAKDGGPARAPISSPNYKYRSFSHASFPRRAVRLTDTLEYQTASSLFSAVVLETQAANHGQGNSVCLPDVLDTAGLIGVWYRFFLVVDTSKPGFFLGSTATGCPLAELNG